SDGAPNDEFGLSVALSKNGDEALIGAIGKTSDKGAAYVFAQKKDSFSQQQELTASDGAPNDVFGSSVALNGNGDEGAVGAPGKNSSQGAAYVYQPIGK